MWVTPGCYCSVSGDKLIIKFLTCGSAMEFAMDVQLALMNAQWPQYLLDIPCAGVMHYGKDTELCIFRGPCASISLNYCKAQVGPRPTKVGGGCDFVLSWRSSPIWGLK